MASVHYDDLTAHGLTDGDADRVALAYETHGRESERWPRPVDVIRRLPRREHRLALPDMPEEEAIANRQKIAQMLRGALKS